VSVIGNDVQADSDVASWLPWSRCCQPLGIVLLLLFFGFCLNDLLFQSSFRLGQFYNDFLQAGWLFCRRLNSVKTLKGMLHGFLQSLKVKVKVVYSC